MSKLVSFSQANLTTKFGKRDEIDLHSFKIAPSLEISFLAWSNLSTTHLQSSSMTTWDISKSTSHMRVDKRSKALPSVA